MALRHYDGPGLPGTEVKKVAPPPSAPTPRATTAPTIPVPVDEPAPRADSIGGALDALEADTGARGSQTQDHRVFVVQLFHLPTGSSSEASAMSLDEAVTLAKDALERVMPVRALVWDDGSPLQGVSRLILSEALELIEQRPDVQGDPTLQLAIGRLKGALGEE